MRLLTPGPAHFIPPPPPPHAKQPADDDAALAKALQEQEAAFLVLATAGGGSAWYEGWPGWEVEYGLGNLGQPTHARHQPARPHYSSSRPQDPPDGDGGDAEDDSEALARRLQAEDDAAHWLALAGVTLPGVGGSGGGGGLSAGAHAHTAVEVGTETAGMTYEALTALTEVVGAAPRGAPKAAVAALRPTIHAAGGEEDEQCAVCREELVDGEELLTLP